MARLLHAICLLSLASHDAARDAALVAKAGIEEEVPSCRQDYTCDRAGIAPFKSTAAARLAVYTYNIGSYEGGMRDKNVPCVLQNMDAFFFYDSDTWQHSTPEAVRVWRERGWQLMPVSVEPGTKFVTGDRLTTKRLKWTPPEWLLNGTWDWLVEFDGNVVIDLFRLGPFLEHHIAKPLLLLDWSYHASCDEDGFDCFSRELNSMLNARQQYIKESRQNILAWSQKLAKEHAGAVPQTRRYAPPFYYETGDFLELASHQVSSCERSISEHL